MIGIFVSALSLVAFVAIWGLGGWTQSLAASLLPPTIALLGVALGIENYQRQKLELTFKLFTDFNCRYAELNSGLSDLCDLPPEPNGIVSPEQQHLLNKYANLCAEEYFWYKKGLIDRTIWKSWEAGIQHYLARSTVVHSFFRSELQQYGKGDTYYAQLFQSKKLKELIPTGEKK